MRQQLKKLKAKRPKLRKAASQARRPSRRKKAVRTAKPFPKAGKQVAPLKPKTKRKRPRHLGLTTTTKTKAQAALKRRRSGGCQPCKRKAKAAKKR